MDQSVIRKQILVFGGFHDNLRDCKYFNDLHSFDLESRTWRKLTTSGPEPTARSACQMFPAPDGRGVVVFGGFCKEKVRKVEKGVTLVDMFLLCPDKHDTTGVKWRWQLVKQVGQIYSCGEKIFHHGKYFILHNEKYCRSGRDRAKGRD